MNKSSAVFLDRDGVLCRAIVRNGQPYAPRSLDEFEIMAGVGEALQRLRGAGYRLIVVTNQPDVARGLISQADVEHMHATMMSALPLDAIKACYEEDGPSCACYKPKPGMLHDSAQEFGLNLKDSFIIGDRWRDVGAGVNAGCRTLFIDRGYREQLRDKPDHVCAELSEAVEIIVSHQQGEALAATKSGELGG